MNQFEEELRKLINQYCIENGSDTPDHILARYMRNCLESYDYAIRDRDRWYKFKPWEKLLNREQKEKVQE